MVEFSGIPIGTVGRVVEIYGERRGGHRGVMIEWTTTDGTTVRDGFGRDAEFDETAYLEMVD